MSRPKQFPTKEALRVLLALGRFRNLTVQQMVRLGVSDAGSIRYIRNDVVGPLRDRKPPYTKQSPKYFALPYIHCMTQFGASELERLCEFEPGSIPYSKAPPNFSPVFIPHRLAQIDFHIEFALWAHQYAPHGYATVEEQDFFVTGSQRGGNMVSATELLLPDSDKKLKPDGVFGMQVGEQQALYVVEVHRATDTRRVAEKLIKYIDALHTGAFSYKYQINTAPYVCSIHLQENVLEGAKQAIRTNPAAADVLENFVFNRVSQITEDFTKGWHFADDRPFDLFPTPKTPNPLPFLEF